LPVSLTHATTRHHRNNRANVISEDSNSENVDFPIAGSMAGMYAVPEGDSHQQDGEEPVSTKRSLEDELGSSRARLGKNEEARLHLENQIRSLEVRFQKGLADDTQRKQDLAAAQKRQKIKEQELARAKKETMTVQGRDSTMSSALRNELGATIKQAQDRIEGEKSDLLKFRDQADVKLRSWKNEERSLQAKNAQLRQELQGQLGTENNLQDELHTAQDEWSRLTGKVEALNRDEAEVSQEQQTEVQRLSDENAKLHSEEEQERQCMDWGHRLEGRLQKELQRKVSDAKLCRDSILSIHNERLELKARSSKYKREIEEEKLREGEARRSYEENQQLLDHCLGQMSR